MNINLKVAIVKQKIYKTGTNKQVQQLGIIIMKFS